MKIHIGSKNEVKINAVNEAILLYPKIFKSPEVQGLDVKIDINGHPKTLEQTISGAIQRAKMAFPGSDYSIGVESGLMEVPYTKDGFMEASTCAIYDGKNVYIGVGPAFEWPTGVVDQIRNHGMDGSQAFKHLKYTEHEKLGAMDGGICNFLTNGRMTREDQIKYSIIMAMIRLEKAELFK